MDTGTLSTMAQVLLADAVSDLGVSAPSRQIVSHGLRFAHDCEMVAVGITTFGFDSTDSGKYPGHPRAIYLPTVTFQIVWLRAWPSLQGDGQLPTAAKISTAALALAVDAAKVGDGISNRWAAGTLFSPTPDPAHLVTVPTFSPISPEGGLAGWRVTVGVRL